MSETISWTAISGVDQLDQIDLISESQMVLIFKHSTRCSISSVALSRLERQNPCNKLAYYFLDLLAYRNVSGAIAERYHVAHESPQVLIISQKECVYDESHSNIRPDDIEEWVSQQATHTA
jgi:bacillithiol system protein YtxJ